MSFIATAASKAVPLAGRFQLRGLDAVYVATAASLGLPLATWDRAQRERAARVVRVVVPVPG